MDHERRSDSKELDNPAWFALTTRQSEFALGGGAARRYPAEVAPFVAVADSGVEAAAAARGLVEPGETLNFIGVVPDDLDGWDVERVATVSQLVFDGRPPEVDAQGIETLGAVDVTEMLSLMAAVYPGYFRPRSHELGAFLGVRDRGRLVAMAGRRMRPSGFREVSGVATLPDHRGRGLAGRLVGRLVLEILAERLTPFLHVDADNLAARAAYEKAGFAWRRDLDVCKARRRS